MFGWFAKRLVLTFVLCTTVLAPENAWAADWVGKRVVLRSSRVRGGRLVNGKVVPSRQPVRASFLVLKDRGAAIQVRDEAEPLWLARGNVILASEAKEYFKTKPLRRSPPTRIPDPDAWAQDTVNALVRFARAAYDDDRLDPAFFHIHNERSAELRAAGLDRDDRFAANHRELVDYLRSPALGQRTDHRLGFTLSDKQYFAEVRQRVAIPDFLMTQRFLRLVSDPDSLEQAKDYLEQLNVDREPDDQLIYFSYRSRHLGTPDSPQSFGRLLILAPADTSSQQPEKWVQFALTDPGAAQWTRNVSVLAAIPEGEGAYRPLFKDYYRTFRSDGTITVTGRWELGEGSDNCVKCHKSGVAPIFPAAGSVTDDERPALIEVNRRYREYGTPRFDPYLDGRELGPGLGSGTAQERAARFGPDFASTAVGKAMICSKCHTPEGRGTLHWPMDRFLIRSFLMGGKMPKNHPLEPGDRSALHTALADEYFALSDAQPGLLKSWLLGQRRPPTPETAPRSTAIAD